MQLARSEGLEVMFVTEDTTAPNRRFCVRVYTVAIESGARRICLADTVGHVTPWGIRALVRFARQVVTDTGAEVKIDYHGHRDRGLSVINSLAALAEGADRVHGCGLGIGEQSGNTPMELLLVNLKLLGWLDSDLHGLPAYCEAVSAAPRLPYHATRLRWEGTPSRPAPESMPARYSRRCASATRGWPTASTAGSPPPNSGGSSRSRWGPMSGQANVVAWLTKRGLECTDETIVRILSAAKAGDHVLADDEIFSLLGDGSEAG